MLMDIVATYERGGECLVFAEFQKRTCDIALLSFSARGMNKESAISFSAVKSLHCL